MARTTSPISFTGRAAPAPGNDVYPYVAPIDHRETEATIASALGSAANATFQRVAKSLDHMNDEYKEGEDREPCDCCTSNEKEWGLFHVGDSWRPYARFHDGTSSSCSQGSEDHTLNAAIPRSIAPGGTLGQPWSEVRAETATVLKLEPAAVRHLFVSPKQDLAVAIGSFGIAVLGVENAHVRSVLKIESFDNACIPVMEQWSLGRFVAAWDAIAQKEAPGSVPTGQNP